MQNPAVILPVPLGNVAEGSPFKDFSRILEILRQAQNDKSHGFAKPPYIKGIRDLFLGLLIIVLVIRRRYKALGISLVLGSIIPAMDAWIVLFYQHMPFITSIPHLSAIAMSLIAGFGFLQPNKKSERSTPGEEVKII